MTERIAVVAASLALAGCHAPVHQQAAAPPLRVAAPPPAAVGPMPVGEELVWIRTDGQRGAGNPMLQRQYEIDVATCPGAAQRLPAAAPCMRERGYVLAPVSQAESLLQQFARARG
jgi:hypothetical protein